MKIREIYARVVLWVIRPAVDVYTKSQGKTSYSQDADLKIEEINQFLTEDMLGSALSKSDTEINKTLPSWEISVCFYNGENPATAPQQETGSIITLTLNNQP